MRIGVITSSMDRPDPRGPGLALMRICREMVKLDHGHELFFVHHKRFHSDLYKQANELRIPRLPLLAGAALAPSRLDAICLNGFHNTLGSFGLHLYPTVRTQVLYAHGTLAYVPDHAYGDSLYPTTTRGRLDNLKMRAAMRLSVRRFDAVQTNSAFTRQVLIKSMGADPGRVTVNHLGIDSGIFRPLPQARLDELRQRFGVDAPCILVAVTDTVPRKNLHTLLAAFRKLKDAGYPHKLLCMGELTPAAQQQAAALGLEQWLLPTGYVTDEEVVAGLYSMSQCLAYTTLHETFGMPILEGFACGCPVITSDVTAMPEVAGGAALLVQRPTDPDELFRRLKDVADSASLRQELASRGLARAAEFSWRETARRYLQIVEKAAQTKDLRPTK